MDYDNWQRTSSGTISVSDKPQTLPFGKICIKGAKLGCGPVITKIFVNQLAQE